ncbi:hypothetical protein L873DRAFT_1864381, partial [Choiromyces venosus 120613-1]
ITNDVVKYLVDRYKTHLEKDSYHLTAEKIEEYVRVVEEGGGGKGVWRFIDGTMRVIYWPVEFQQRYHSRYKKYHSFKFQAVMITDGLLSSLSRPWPG